MYYVIETKYTGPNCDQNEYVDADRIEIRTCPARANLSREPRIYGWCGTTNDWSVYAHGEYDTLDAARAAITELFGEVRDSDGDSFASDDEDVVETYRPGKYAPLTSEATANWAYAGLRSDITADTTDERIAALVAEYEAAANSDGYTLDSDLELLMRKYRQELRDDLVEVKTRD